MSKKHEYRKQTNRTLAVFTAIFAVIGALLVINVLSLSIFGYHINSGTNVRQYSGISVTTQTIYARRGYIFDSGGSIIAEDTVSYNMYAYLDSSRPGYEGTPSYVPEDEYEEYAEKLGEILGCDPQIILDYFQQDLYQTEFGTYGRGLSKEIKEKIEAQGFYGIEFTEENSRNYPLGSFASHLIGYTRYDSEDEVQVGEMGVESILNDYLLGKNGYSRFNQDAYGHQLIGTQSEYVAAVNGNNVYLTIDRTIEEGLDVLMDSIQQRFNASKIWIGVMEVETGRMLGWDCWPTFDPNKLDIVNYLDYGSQMAYEPGSTMKTFTYAAAIDSGHFSYTDKYYDDAFLYLGLDDQGNLIQSSQPTDIGTISNANERAYGWITLPQAYYHSLNCGIGTLLTHYITPEILQEYLDRFGFFKKVNTDAVTDVSGTKHMDYPLDQVATGYGQSSTVTMLQMMQAYSAIMNEGKMMRPYFVDRIEDPYSGATVYQGAAHVVGQPITASTAQQMVDLMRGVVVDDFGIGEWYDLPNIQVFLKTGTGQIGTSTGYDPVNVTSSVILGMPYNDPKVMVYICYQAPVNPNMNYETGPEKQFLQKIIQHLQLSDNPQQNTGTHEATQINPGASYRNTMPSLINHSIAFANETLSSYNVSTIYLGSGDNVIRQYPEAGETITQGERVFLVTSDGSYTMPDMTGWSRKDVTAFWQLTGIAVDMDGYGYVVSQSLAAGSAINADTQIQVTFGK